MKFWKSALLYAATVCTLTAVSCSDETKEPNLYTTAVTDDGNGTAKAAPASAAAGETITLTATPKENFSFAKWTVLSGDAELKSATANPTTFAMPAANVEIKAEFAAVPSQITVTDDGQRHGRSQPRVGHSRRNGNPDGNARRELLLPEMDGPQRRYRAGKSDGKPDDVHPAGGGGKYRNQSRIHRPAFACSLRNHRV